jgi:hypothetical protein
VDEELAEDSLVRREVRGRRCFVIEFTARGRELVDQAAGPDGRRIGTGDIDERPLWDGSWTSPSSLEPDLIRGRTAAAADGLEGPWELLRREFRDVLMEIGARQYRVTELECPQRTVRPPRGWRTFRRGMERLDGLEPSSPKGIRTLSLPSRRGAAAGFHGLMPSVTPALLSTTAATSSRGPALTAPPLYRRRQTTAWDC